MALIHHTPRRPLMVRVKRQCILEEAELPCTVRRLLFTMVVNINIILSILFDHRVSFPRSRSRISMLRYSQPEIVHHIIMVVPHPFMMALELLELGILLFWIHPLANRIWTDSIWTIRTTRCQTSTTYLRHLAVIMHHLTIHFRRTILLRHLVIIVR